ncbi:MAG: wax ester/triacylglycerol synthase family O-acyltransferase [Pseudomonadota bacterium]
MEQLSGTDSLFLYSETENAPMQLSAVLLYDAATAPNGRVRFEDIVNTFRNRLDRSTVFRRKLLRVPLDLDQPYWVEDVDFDLEFHMRHVALPHKGDWDQFCALVARIHSRPLDMTRPLWEAYMIEGLDHVDSQASKPFALLVKVHHSAIDGATGTQIMGAIHDLTAEVNTVLTEPAPVENTSNTSRILWRAWVNNLGHPMRMTKLIGRALPIMRRIREGEQSNRFRRLGKKEKTPFNASISSQRVFGAVDCDLAKIREVKRSVKDATVNDVMLTIISGALRSYLLEKGQLPEKSLVAGAPVNVRSEDEAESGGNIVSVMSIAIRTDIADPLKRLGAVHEEAVRSKAYHNAIGARVMTDISNSLPALITSLGFRAAAAASLLGESQPIFNTQITNVPGPQVPIYMSGAKMVRSLSAGPCMNNLGLFNVVTSYAGVISMSFTCCREMMPDPRFYEACLQDSYLALLASAG